MFHFINSINKFIFLNCFFFYRIQQDGRLKSVEVYGYQKRYDPEKYYTYILKVERVNQPDPSYLFRSFKEFVEFQQKLCILFPLARCHRYY